MTPDAIINEVLPLLALAVIVCGCVVLAAIVLSAWRAQRAVSARLDAEVERVLGKRGGR